MSTAIAVRNPFFFWEDPYEPVSEGSRAIQQLSANNANYRRGSATDWSPIVEAALLSIRRECAQRDWDGEDTLPVTDRTIGIAATLIECLFTMLPRGTPAPDIVPEPDGEICITWAVDRDRVFSMSVGAHRKINFSGQFGKEGSVHGWQPIDPTSRSVLEKSLQDVARQVARLYPHVTDRGNAQRVA
jgi:hypothetical protein